MKAKNIKTSINQLVKKLGNREAVSERLGITTRYIRMLQKNERKASGHLALLIKLMIEE